MTHRVGEATKDVGERDVGEITRWRNHRNSLTKRKAAISKFSALAIISLHTMIIARYDAIHDQLEHAHHYNHHIMNVRCFCIN